MASADGSLSSAFETRMVNGFPVIVRKGEEWAEKPKPPKAAPVVYPSPFKGHPIVSMMQERLTAAAAAPSTKSSAGADGAAAGGASGGKAGKGGGKGGKEQQKPAASGAGADPPAAAGGKRSSKSKKGGLLNGGGQVAADPSRVWVPSKLPLDERVALAMSCAEEVTTEAELRTLFEKKDMPVCYDGFEPSGRMHIAQGVLKSIIVNKLTAAGCRFRFWVADWFALLNNKMGGDLAKIQTVGRYFVEVWKAVGMNMDNVEFLWASEEINKQPDQYWMRVMDVARHSTLKRVQRCCTIMGRAESESMPSAQILYPCMQCADIFYLGADICQLGMDQRKVNMLAREYVPAATDKKRLRFPPVVLSHHMLMGLKEGQAKMSKSDPDSAIFMEDTEADVKRKIKRAFCPPEVVKDNPCLDWMKHIIFPRFGGCAIQREGEDAAHEYTKYEELEADYSEGKVHPSRLKPVLTELINVCLEPVRKHFASGEPKKLLALVKKYRVTR